MSSVEVSPSPISLPPAPKMVMSYNAQKRELEMEQSSISTNSSTASTASMTTSNGSSKLSKIGKRLRDSCRNLRGKQKSNRSPAEYTSIQAPNESMRAKHYVAMDFTGKVGKIVDNKDLVRGVPTKDGYAYFRRKITPSSNAQMTEIQKTIHQSQPWFHPGIGRELAQRILATHRVDGVFLVRESSVKGGFVISYFFNGRTFHAQVLPESHPEDGVAYSLDDGKTRFFDLLQLVEFYQLNRASLHTRLKHYIIYNNEQQPQQRAPSPNARSDCSSSSCRVSDSSLDSQNSQEAADVSGKKLHVDVKENNNDAGMASESEESDKQM